MTVDEALIHVKKYYNPAASAAGALAVEVQRLREQRKTLQGAIPHFTPLSPPILSILNEMTKMKLIKPKEEMTVDEAISWVETHYDPKAAGKRLVEEIWRLREKTEILEQDQAKKNTKITQLRECQVRAVKEKNILYDDIQSVLNNFEAP